jgi:transcriptional regulator with XRE-family HTH domain
MKSHPVTGEDVRSWRESHRLSQEDLGKLLDTSREWIGMIERGSRPISADLYLRFENLKREPRFDSAGAESASPPGMLREDAAPYGSPEMLANEARRILDTTLHAAGDDTAKLGWVREQMRSHLSMPAHWKMPRGPLVPVTLPSQTQLLSSKTGKPIPVPPASRSAQTG